MKISAIKEGRTYETKLGVGVVVRVGGTFPPSVKIDITQPFPRGIVLVTPRDVIKEVK